MEKVSIIMPVYNVEKYLDDSINSVINQSYKDFELILINDGSSDKSDEICKKYEKKDKRIKYVYQKNSGVSAARNNGIKIATGDYIAFIDSDDIYEEEYLKNMIEDIKKNRSDLTICSYTIFAKSSKKININNDIVTTDKTEIIEKLQPLNLFNQIWNKLYIKKIIDDNKISFDKNISIAEDYDFNLKYIKYCKKISYFDENLYRYRISETGLGFSFRMDANEIKIRMVNNLEKLYEGRDKEYIYKMYIKQYISYYARIFDRRNLMSKKDKKLLLKKLQSSEEFKNNLEKCMKSNNFTTKFATYIISLKNTFVIKVISKLASIYDNHQKKKIFDVMK